MLIIIPNMVVIRPASTMDIELALPPRRRLNPSKVPARVIMNNALPK